MSNNTDTIQAIDENIRKAESLLREALWSAEETRLALNRLYAQRDTIFILTGAGKEGVGRFNGI